MPALIASSTDTILRAPSEGHLEAADAPSAIRYEAVKLLFDLAFSLVLLALAAPVILLTAVLVKLTSAGPAFYTQLRVGRNGRVFWIYKIRTMTHNCESKSGAKWATASDSRVTRLGRFLRKTHLDELPQLWNVLRGDMSLVGPRPERPEFCPGLEERIPNYRERLAVRPGLTGLAQVQLPADTSVESVQRKLVYDLYYIEHRSLWLDVRLILSTALKMAHLPFKVSRKLFQIPDGTIVERNQPAILDQSKMVLEPQVACLQPDVA